MKPAVLKKEKLDRDKLILQMYEKIVVVHLDEDDERVIVMLETKCFLLH